MNDEFWVEEESNGKLPFLMKRKRKVGKRKIEFIGWGSRPLMEFLEVIGQDTLKKHSQREVSEFVTKYIHDKGLLCPVKKNKKVLCDEILLALFEKRLVSRTKIYDLLEEHFAENHNDSDDDLFDSSEDETHKENLSKHSHKRVALKTPKSCFAAIIPENIKLVYLKRTLVQELLKSPQNFEHKVMGSFVRMKSDPNDIYQKNLFQLQQVTGVKKLSQVGDADIEICLRVSNYFKDVPICMLSDDNFSKEEMEDLQGRIKAGLLKRLTVEELESKVQTLHIDITKHWIYREISLLQKLIDHANEKGRRRELFEFLERRKVLQNPSEQEKLLLTIPEVVAEELVTDDSIAVSNEKAGSNSSPCSAPVGLDISSTDTCGWKHLANPIAQPLVASWNRNQPFEMEKLEKTLSMENEGPLDLSIPSQNISVSSNAIGVKNVSTFNGVIPEEAQNVLGNSASPPQDTLYDSFPSKKEGSGVDADIRLEVPKNCQPLEFVQLEPPTPNKTRDCITTELILVLNSPEKDPPQKLERAVAPPTEVIELSDDEPEEDAECTTNIRAQSESMDDDVWHYLDPQGHVQGPFSLYLLKRWRDYNYFHPGFTVWKTGQSPDQCILLADVLRQIFHC